MTNKSKNIATLLLSCPDQRGLVAKLSNFVFNCDGNIIDLDEHVDYDTNRFFIRIEWDYNCNDISIEELIKQFTPLAEELKSEWKINSNSHKKRIAIFVSKYDHCLQDILWRISRNEYDADFPLIVSNHEDLRKLAEIHGIDYHYFPISKENKVEQEKRELELLKSKKIDTIILARYMQVLTSNFIDNFRNNIINIHHSFLPAFMGGNPYKQAYNRGVKIIGATSHYVTENLDEGPIIEQDIIRISHKDDTKELMHKGKDIERLVLSRAIKLHLENRILTHGNKTIVFH